MKQTSAGTRRRRVAWLGGVLILTAIGPWLVPERPRSSVRVAQVDPAPPAEAPTVPSAATAVREVSAGERSAFLSQLAKRSLSPEPMPSPASRGNPVIQERVARIEPDFRAQLQALAAAEPGTRTLHVPSLGADDFEFTVTRQEGGANDQGAVVGELVGKPGSHVILGYADDAVAGTIMIPGEGLFRVRYAGDGQHRIAELDPSRIPQELPPLVAPETVHAAVSVPPPALAGIGISPATMEPANPVATAGGDLLTEAPTQLQPSAPTGGGTLAPVAQADAATVVDVLVVYTPASASANGGASGVVALINAAAASANTAYVNSGVSLSVRVVYTGSITYTESGALATDLPRFANTSDGYMDGVHALRNQYSADLVCLIVTSGTDAAGIAYLWGPSSSASAFSPYAFSVVMDDYADANLTFAHELGHNMGCGHARADGGGAAYSYSYGWKFTASGTAYRTVMAYAPGIRLPYFSNPNVRYLGTATGAADANNAATLNNSRTTMAAIRQAAVPYLEWSVYASADLNADSKPDLIWRSSTSGRVIVWYMDGATQSSTATLWPASSPGDSAWVPVAAGDFNADGKPDLIWRNTTSGRVIIWYMDGATRTSTATIWAASAVGDSLWVPIATGDFNADNKPDIVWRNSSTGRVIVWTMDGATRTGTTTIWAASAVGDSLWVPITTADMNGDEKPDIVWRNSSTGRVIVWTMNGTTRVGTTTLWAAGTASDALWVPAAAGDFNADGKPDLVWRQSSTGRVIQWLMDGTTRSSTANVWGP